MTHWADELADHVLAGGRIDRAAARRVLGAPDGEVPDLLRATARVREHFVGRRVKLCQLRNARSGLCPEDCHYCSQSAVSEADIPRYTLDSAEELLAGSRRAAAAGARRFCMVTSGRGPSARDIDRFCDAARRIKAEQPELELCVSAGIMDENQARALKASGVDYVNHNLNTSARHHGAICSTHTYEDRVRTVEAVRRAGLHTCCGGILGMGESAEDVVDLAFALRDLAVDSLPVNFLIPIEGTPFAGRRELSPTDCLRALCLFRLTNPAAEIRMAGGGEGNLGWFRPLALHVVNSIFVDGYLTTPGQAYQEAQAMVAEMGYEVEA
ncbi:MAG: biotin synthase BioB [Candidatus Binatia bacterium]